MADCHCGREAVTFVAYNGRHLCDDHFLRFVDKRVKMELHRQGRLPAGTVAVALSGGKDSVMLLHFLHAMTKDRPDVDLAAITVDEGIRGYRDTAMDICKAETDRLGVPWHVVRTKDLAGYDIDTYAAGGGHDATGQERPACGACGVFRRAGLNRKARELGAAALATGHNLDDTAQTILMNVLDGDVERMGRMAPHAPSVAGEDEAGAGLVPRLQPLRTIPEKEVLLYAMLKGLPIHDEAECPYAARAHRWRIRDVLWKLETGAPGTRHKILAFHEGMKERLPAAGATIEMSTCTECGDPTSGAVCMACRLRG